MLPSYLQWPCHTYLALGGDIRIRLTGNGIMYYIVPYHSDWHMGPWQRALG
jgi:hypothetical protein